MANVIIGIEFLDAIDFGVVCGITTVVLGGGSKK